MNTLTKQPVTNQTVHTFCIEITLEGRSQTVTVEWTFGLFDVPRLERVLDGRTDVTHLLNYISRGAIEMAIDRAAHHTPIEVQMEKMVNMIEGQRKEVSI